MNAMPALPTFSQHAKMKTILIVEDEPITLTGKVSNPREFRSFSPALNI
jgi:hypothetical protein